jgi:homoserine dehydrogenase
MIDIGLLGYGHIGRGVKEQIDALSSKWGIRLSKVFDMPAKKEELQGLYVSDYKEVTEDKNISVVIECLGGDELPYQAICSALVHQKSVISSNKETISLHLKEYLRLAEINKVSLQFEASCGGGIPLLNPLQTIASFDQVLSLRGILNGTCNYILTKMQKEQKDFLSALKEAQDKGFAEKDPTADLEGLDMVRKSNILSSLAFSCCLKNEEIPHFGIRNVSPFILSYFNKQNKTVRFVADLSYKEGRLAIGVIPEAFSSEEILSKVDYETNGIQVICAKNGPLAFIGYGAGKEATSSAVMQDLFRCVSHTEMKISSDFKPYRLEKKLAGRILAFKGDQEPSLLLNPSFAELSQFSFVIKEI